MGCSSMRTEYRKEYGSHRIEMRRYGKHPEPRPVIVTTWELRNGRTGKLIRKTTFTPQLLR